MQNKPKIVNLNPSKNSALSEETSAVQVGIRAVSKEKTALKQLCSALILSIENFHFDRCSDFFR